jgi:hypothetical protein
MGVPALPRCDIEEKQKRNQPDEGEVRGPDDDGLRPLSVLPRD